MAAAARKYGIARQMVSQKRQKYRRYPTSEAKRLKVQELDNAWLKWLLGEQELELESLTEIAINSLNRTVFKLILNHRSASRAQICRRKDRLERSNRTYDKSSNCPG